VVAFSPSFSPDAVSFDSRTFGATKTRTKIGPFKIGHAPGVPGSNRGPAITDINALMFGVDLV